MKSKISYLSVLVISAVLCAIVFAGCTHTFKCGICKILKYVIPVTMKCNLWDRRYLKGGKIYVLSTMWR